VSVTCSAALAGTVRSPAVTDAQTRAPTRVFEAIDLFMNIPSLGSANANSVALNPQNSQESIEK
jgi:hypothetical protein